MRQFTRGYAQRRHWLQRTGANIIASVYLWHTGEMVNAQAGGKKTKLI